MAQNKNDKFEVDGVVEECLPGGKFRVKVMIKDTEVFVIAHISGKMRLHYIKLIIGDKVKVEMSLYDLTKGRITFRSNN